MTSLTDYYYFASYGGTVAPPPPGGSDFATTVLALSPSAYWRLGESVGATAVDETATQDGTYLDSPTLGVAGLTSDDTAVTFATADGVSAADNADWDFGTGDFTLMWGMKRSGTWPAVVEFLMGHDGDGGTGSWAVNINTGTEGRLDLRFETTAYVVRSVTPSSTVLSDGSWHLCFITADRDANAEFWIDGVSQWTVSIAASSAVDLTNTRVLYLGRRAAGNTFIGSMDEVAIWKGTLLSSTDISAIQAAI